MVWSFDGSLTREARPIFNINQLKYEGYDWRMIINDFRLCIMSDDRAGWVASFGIPLLILNDKVITSCTRGTEFTKAVLEQEKLLKRTHDVIMWVAERKGSDTGSAYTALYEELLQTSGEKKPRLTNCTTVGEFKATLEAIFHEINAQLGNIGIETIDLAGLKSADVLSIVEYFINFSTGIFEINTEVSTMNPMYQEIVRLADEVKNRPGINTCEVIARLGAIISLMSLEVKSMTSADASKESLKCMFSDTEVREPHNGNCYYQPSTDDMPVEPKAVSTSPIPAKKEQPVFTKVREITATHTSAARETKLTSPEPVSVPGPSILSTNTSSKSKPESHSLQPLPTFGSSIQKSTNDLFGKTADVANPKSNDSEEFKQSSKESVNMYEAAGLKPKVVQGVGDATELLDEEEVVDNRWKVAGIDLKLVEKAATGTEEEEILFSSNCVLHKYNTTDKAWVSIGLGTCQISKEPSNGSTRFIYRQSSTDKVFANHYIPHGCKLLPMANKADMRTWTCLDINRVTNEPETMTLGLRVKLELMESFVAEFTAGAERNVVLESR